MILDVDLPDPTNSGVYGVVQVTEHKAFIWQKVNIVDGYKYNLAFSAFSIYKPDITGSNRLNTGNNGHIKIELEQKWACHSTLLTRHGTPYDYKD